MSWMYVCLVLFVAFTSRAEESSGGRRILHRLVGGHLRLPSDSADTELIGASAGAGKDKQKGNEDEEKKTLAQQVADGKYGLIQKELFSKPLKKPGVISYESNSEVPKDTISNLGGLDKNEIWLSENHLLVLTGGTYPTHDNNKPDYNKPSLWPPIDEYSAPRRQVKIPANPKVPPPFPVQLTEGGPLQLLGTNSSRTINGTFGTPPFALPPPEGYVPGEGPYFPPEYPYPPNATSGETPFPIPPFAGPVPGDYYPGDGPINGPFPFPLNGTLPPFFASLPPGAAVLPPPNNLTDQYDEEDPSIYYPPPYSFFFPKDNSTLVPPGPLVPGIVLPPPPDFFAPLETTTKRPKVTSSAPRKQIRPTTTPLPPTPVLDGVPPQVINELKPITLKPVPKNRTYLPVKNRGHKPQTVTILKAVEPSTTSKPVYYYDKNDVRARPFAEYGPPPRIRPVITSTQVPLRAYFTTSNEIDTNSATQTSRKIYPDPPPPKPNGRPVTQFYFYEEDAVTTPRSTGGRYFNIPKEFYVPARKQPNREPQVYYITTAPRTRYQLVKTTSKPDSFKIHIARLQQQLQSYYTTPKPYHGISSPKPVYQYSFEAANYQQQHNKYQQPTNEDQFRPIPRYNVQIQQAIEVRPTEAPAYQSTPRYYTPEPQYYLPNAQKPQFYSTPRPDYNYVATPQPEYYSATPSPIYDNYYTKQDDGYLDDITKKYFTIFGKKLPGTSPIPQEQATTANPIRDSVYAENYNQKPVSLESDTLVNYVQPRPSQNPDAIGNQKANYAIRPAQYVPRGHPLRDDVNVNYLRPRPAQNPDAELIGDQKLGRYVTRGHSLRDDVNVNYVNPPRRNPDAEAIRKRPQQQQQGSYEIEPARFVGEKDEIGYARPQNSNAERGENYQIQPARYVASAHTSLRDDINVNYRQPRPPINPDAEIIDPVDNNAGEGRPGSFISYELPGDGAHFYFLTPQLAQSREQGAGFYYTNNNLRKRRNQKGER